MIDRLFYKTRAKVNLKGKWLIAALVGLVLLISTGNDVFNFKFGSNSNNNHSGFSNDMMNQAADLVPFGGVISVFRENVLPFLGIFLPIFLIMLAAGIAFQAFVMGPLSLGAYQYFRLNDLGEEQADISQFLWAFRSRSYLNIVKILFLVNLKLILWSLLFIVPGIVKAYEYSMIPYLLSRDPGMSADEAFAQTRFLTLGKKSSLFILDLSFLGWGFLGALAFGLGTPFVKAYETQTKAGIFNDWIGDTAPDYSATSY